MTKSKNHWAFTDKRSEVLDKVAVGWKNLRSNPKKGEDRICPICNNKFYVKRAYLIKGGGKYCSQKCSGSARKGIIPSNLKIAQSKSPIGKKGINYYHTKGEKHWAWQNENPSYRAVHSWIQTRYGPATKCENPNCFYPRKDRRGNMMITPKSYQWANVSGQYKRDKSDFIELCASCHKQYDLGIIHI